MSQVINNLLINADQAMPEGGTIHVNYKNVIIGTNDVPPLKDGKYVMLSIIDQGVGISENQIQKIFDPYRKLYKFNM